MLTERSIQESQDVSGSVVRRCAGCGQRLPSPPPLSCPLCGFDFGTDERVTGTDVTPYAAAYARGERGWRVMAEWVWFAGAGRLKHLALMRMSAASVRFARWNILLFVVTIGLVMATTTGFQWVSASAAAEKTGSVTPLGDGWIHLASTPRPLPLTMTGETKVDLWWNPSQSVIGWASGTAVVWLLAVIVLALVRVGITRAHEEKYRQEERMTAAVNYGTAWMLPFVVAALVLCLLPISHIGSIAKWSWYPPSQSFTLSAAVIAGFGAAMGWFWLVRLAATAPPQSRGKVSAFCAIVVPVYIVGAGLSWWYGLGYLYRVLFDALRLTF